MLKTMSSRLALLARHRLRYWQAMRELRRLDQRDLDELGLGRVDFPDLAWRHATGAEPRRPSQL
jgi:hypothetical protein